MHASTASYNPIEREYVRRELERRQAARQQQQAALRALPYAEFARRTRITVPAGATDAEVPFELWPAQVGVLDTMERERLIIMLKARQLGISWLACLFVLRQCALYPRQTWLLFSQGQLEANELISRIGFLYHHHEDRTAMARLVTDNTHTLEWDHGSRVLSLPATKRAGRSFTASGVIIDERAFMLWGTELLAAVKPTIDAGGKLFEISSADGPGTSYHQEWEAAKSGATGYTHIFLPWSARPDRGPGWRDEKVRESGGDTATVYREYPANDLEAFANAAGLVYDVWSDGSDDGNVTEAADYVEGAGPVLWAVDDGYSGKLDQETGLYTAQSHPRVFLLCQLRPDGRLCVFAESYACGLQNDEHLAQVLALPYPAPEYAAVDKSAAELKGRIHQHDIYTQNGPASVEESIKVLRRMLAPDANGWRRVLVHPRCRHLRAELARYRKDDKDQPVKAFDHGPDALRYGAWTQRNEE